MKKRSELKAELKELRRDNQILREAVAAKGQPLMEIVNSSWLGVRHITLSVSIDGTRWAIAHEAIMADAPQFREKP